MRSPGQHTLYASTCILHTDAAWLTNGDQVREIVHYFTGQTELLPEGETLDNHWEHRIDELNRLEEDKSNKDPATGGLFQGTFNDGDNFPLSPIHDLDDGVVRCPRCTHELEEGQCNRCGYIYDRDGSDELDDDGEDIDYDDFDDDRTVDLDFESDALPEDESEMPFHDYDAPWAEAIERARREYRRRSHSAEDGDENEENSEEDENSEMDDFIVEDEEGDERSSRPHYSDSSLSNSEGRFGFDGHHDSARIEDDDSDVHLIRHRPRRRVISIEDDDDESSDEETDASQGEHRSRVNGRAHSVSEHELSSDGDRYNEDDDEEPILARSRRRRRLSDTISDSDAE
ncbi:E3 ubiquitin ligase, partial [Ascosphaera atra]